MSRVCFVAVLATVILSCYGDTDSETDIWFVSMLYISLIHRDNMAAIVQTMFFRIQLLVWKLVCFD